MLKLAVAARLPLIRVETDDPVHISRVLAEVTGETVALGTIQQFNKVLLDSVTFVFGDQGNADWNLIYQIFATKPATLIVVGGPQHPAFFEAGFVTAPKALIHDFVMKYAKGEEALKITNALSGLSYKQVIEISELAMADKGEYSARAVEDMRRKFFGAVRGLELVNTTMPLYDPPEFLTTWLNREGPFVFGNVPHLLRPRGLLFTGKPGTGKTMGAKFIASALEQPLYRLDIGLVMSKWAGESEKNLQVALRQAENCAPCVMLLDEVEKLFTGAEEGGVNIRLLASLLWWLQEHEKQVFTLMTTNNYSLIPPELIRPGRIDRSIQFPMLGASQRQTFVTYLLDALKEVYELPLEERMRLQESLLHFGPAISHAQVTTMVLGAIKKAYLDKTNVASKVNIAMK